MASPESYTGTITNRKSDEVITIMDSVARIDELKPATTDEETLKKLIDVVTEARFRNESIKTMRVYTHVLIREPSGIRSPMEEQV